MYLAGLKANEAWKRLATPGLEIDKADRMGHCPGILWGPLP